MNANLYDLFKNRFPQDSGKTFLDCGGAGRYSFGDLEARTARFAGALRSLDVQPGDRVAVQVAKSADNVFLYLACLRAGAVYLPLNTAYTAAEVAYFLSDATPKLFVCDSERETELSSVAGQCHVPGFKTLAPDGMGSFQMFARDSVPFDDVVERAASDLAGICYTSGTTGRSKGAMLSHGNLAANALTLHRIWRWQDGDVLLHALPIFHVHGLFVALHCALLNGSTIIFHEKFDVGRVLSDLPRATVFMGVPTFYTRLLQNPDFNAESCGRMRLFISGSAPLLENTFEEFKERTGHTILERYGMSEAGMITSNPYDGPRVAGTVGPALPDVSLRVCDRDGVEVPANETGVLEIKGPNLFQGYWQMPEKTAEEFREDGYFITGDLARMDENGVVTIVGRAKDLVISGGYNIYPKEVELVIDAIPGVGESAVIGVPHPDFGEAVVAVVTRAGDEALDPQRVIDACRNVLAAFKVPKQVCVVDDLPRNTMGKVQKAELRQRFADNFQG